MELLLTGILILAAVAAVITVAKRTASHKFKCNHCSKEFYIKWYKVIFTMHTDNEYELLCPLCNIKDWCTEQPKK